jgi:hypothetical protein
MPTTVLGFEFVDRRGEDIALPRREGSGVHCPKFGSENSLLARNEWGEN